MKIRLINYKTTFPKLDTVFDVWFSINSFFKGKMIHINVKHYTLEIDFR